MNQRYFSRLGVAQLHGLLRRYDNLIEQCQLAIRSETLSKHYQRQKLYLEQADAFLSVGSTTKFGVAVASFVTAEDRTEYLVDSYDKTEYLDETERELAAVKAALDVWLEKSFCNGKLVIVTSSEQVFAVLDKAASSQLDEEEGSLTDQQEQIHQLLVRHNCNAAAFSIRNNRLVRLLLKSLHEDEEYFEAAEDFICECLDVDECHLKKVKFTRSTAATLVTRRDQAVEVDLAHPRRRYTRQDYETENMEKKELAQGEEEPDKVIASRPESGKETAEKKPEEELKGMDNKTEEEKKKKKKKKKKSEKKAEEESKENDNKTTATEKEIEEAKSENKATEEKAEEETKEKDDKVSTTEEGKGTKEESEEPQSREINEATHEQENEKKKNREVDETPSDPWGN